MQTYDAADDDAEAREAGLMPLSRRASPDYAMLQDGFVRCKHAIFFPASFLRHIGLCLVSRRFRRHELMI